MLNQEIVREATRLTRAGQLVEATALLQRMLHGGRAPKPEHRNAAQPQLSRLDPLTIDATADVVEEREAPHPPSAHSPQRRRRTPPLDFSGHGLRSPITRAPLSPSDIVPVGTRFIAGTFSNAAGTRTYKLFIPSRYRGQRLP